MSRKRKAAVVTTTEAKNEEPTVTLKYACGPGAYAPVQHVDDQLKFDLLLPETLDFDKDGIGNFYEDFDSKIWIRPPFGYRAVVSVNGWYASTKTSMIIDENEMKHVRLTVHVGHEDSPREENQEEYAKEGDPFAVVKLVKVQVRAEEVEVPKPVADAEEEEE